MHETEPNRSNDTSKLSRLTRLRGKLFQHRPRREYTGDPALANEGYFLLIPSDSVDLNQPYDDPNNDDYDAELDDMDPADLMRIVRRPQQPDTAKTD